MNEDPAHTCPEGLRITDGPRYTLRRVAWPPTQKFYHITDLTTGTEYYKTSLEVSILCKVKFRTFKSRISKVSQTVFHNRWEVQKIPRFVFIEKTGRKTKVLRDFFWRY